MFISELNTFVDNTRYNPFLKDCFEGGLTANSSYVSEITTMGKELKI
jgi:hypothetical protein